MIRNLSEYIVTGIKIFLNRLVLKGMSFGCIFRYDVKYYVTLRQFQRVFYNLEVIKIFIIKKFKSFTLQINNQT